eukprot:gene16860-19215_t
MSKLTNKKSSKSASASSKESDLFAHSSSDGPSSSQESEGTRRSGRPNAGVPPFDSSAYEFNTTLLRPNAKLSSTFVASSPADPIVLDSSDSEVSTPKRKKGAKISVDPIEEFSDSDNKSMRSPSGPSTKTRSTVPSKLVLSASSPPPSSRSVGKFSSATSEESSDKSAPGLAFGSVAPVPQRQALLFASTSVIPFAEPAIAGTVPQASGVAASSIPATPGNAAIAESSLAGSTPSARMLSPAALSRVAPHSVRADALPVVSRPSAKTPTMKDGPRDAPLQESAMRLFPLPVRGYVPPTNPPPVPSSVMPSPGSSITSTVHWNPHHRMEMLLSIRSFCNQDPHNTVRFVLEAGDFTPTVFRGFLEYLASRTHHSEFFRMALSAISEAFCGSPSRYTTETTDTLKASILNAVGSAKDLEDLVRNRPISSFTPMFLALFSPQSYPDLLQSCGFCDPQSLSLPRPPGPASTAPALEVYRATS